MRLRAQDGQSSVELVAMLPLLVVITVAVAQLLAGGVAHELAAHAAENGAIAMGEDEDPKQAVRDALPGWAKERVRVTIKGRQVRVRLTPVTVFPGAGEALAADARADAGPRAGAQGAVTAISAAPPPAAVSAGFGAVLQPSRDMPDGLASPAR
ncbi:MAG: hypothetical protein JWM93_2613 [Frankiales bacterium]|nr:hypothetical protein [Frankiales bacterium]MCW3016955.1 hypothetical protein [Solirubrobacterales bacterium]